MTQTQPNDALKRFHAEYCPDAPINSMQCFRKLLSELARFKQQEDTGV